MTQGLLDEGQEPDNHDGSESLVMTGELARVLADEGVNVTTQTIRNWREAGKITAAGSTTYRGRQVPTFDPDRVLEQLGRSRRTRHGGRRRGAGRPRTQELAGEFSKANTGRRAAEDILDAIQRLGDEDPDAAARAAERLGGVLRIEDLALLGRAQLETLAAYGPRVGLTAERLSTVHEVIKCQKTQLDVAERSRQLVSAREIENVWSRALSVFRRRLEGLADRTAPRIVGATGAAAEVVPEVRQILDEAVKEVLATLAEGPLGEAAGAAA